MEAQDNDVDYDKLMDAVEGESTFDSGEVTWWVDAVQSRKGLGQLLFFANRRQEIRTHTTRRTTFLALNDARKKLDTEDRVDGLDTEEKIVREICSLLAGASVPHDAWSQFQRTENRTATGSK